MRRVALLLALLHAAGGVAAADGLPAWMPAPPPPVGVSAEREARRLRHEAAVFGAVGLGLFAAGVAVDVVALDVPQGEHAVPVGDGSYRIEHFRNDANWAEFALGTALFATGFGLVVMSLYRVKQARRLVE